MLDARNSKSFDRKLRLLTTQDYANVFKTAKKLRATHSVIYTKLNNLEYSRLGMVVAKKNVRHAVKRNTIKRIIRETFRQKRQELGHIDIIFIAYSGLGNYNKAELHQCLNTQWHRLKLQFKSA